MSVLVASFLKSDHYLSMSLNYYGITNSFSKPHFCPDLNSLGNIICLMCYHSFLDFRSSS